MNHWVAPFPLLLCLLLIGCPAPVAALPPVTQSFEQGIAIDANRWQEYQDEQGRYRVAVPIQWSQLQSAESTDIIHFVNLAESGVTRAGITIIVQGPTANLQAVADGAQKTLQTQTGISALNVISEAGITVNGLRGLERVLQYKIAEQSLTNRTIYLQHPNHLIIDPRNKTTC